MPSTTSSNILRLFAYCALFASPFLYFKPEYTGICTIAPFACATTYENIEGAGHDANKTPTEISVCAINNEEDFLAQSENQTPITTNLLLVCPHVADAVSRNEMLFTRQLRNYIDFQLKQPLDERLHWIFFLKDRDILFSHSPRSLPKLLASAPTGTNVVSFGYERAQHALGLFAIRVDDWSVRLLDSVLQLRHEQPGLTEAKAMTSALALENNRNNVAHAPRWWREIRGNCPEPATWETQFGFTTAVKMDQLCCVSNVCQDALGRSAGQKMEAGDQVVHSQSLLITDSGLSIEQTIEDFWTCVRNLVIEHDARSALEFSDALAAEQRIAGACRNGQVSSV